MANGEDKNEQYNMGYISGKLSGIDVRLQGIEKSIGQLNADFTSLERGRLTNVESRLSYLFGILGVAGVVLPIVLTVAVNYFWQR